MGEERRDLTVRLRAAFAKEDDQRHACLPRFEQERVQRVKPRVRIADGQHIGHDDAGIAPLVQRVAEGFLAQAVWQMQRSCSQRLELFLDGKIGFMEIGDLVSEAVSEASDREDITLGDILECDREIRVRTLERAEK